MLSISLCLGFYPYYCEILAMVIYPSYRLHVFGSICCLHVAMWL
jgi:hypothetical protein